MQIKDDYSPTRSLHIGIIAGEASGDILGAGLIRALQQQYPGVRISAVAGPRMAAAGCEVLHDSDELAVMGLVEVITHLPRLWRLRRQLITHFLQNRPDVFVGIDAPDFNLALERRLKAAGIPTVHYTSPSVWAWRRWRVRGIAKSVSCMLTLFPFETAFYARHQVAAEFVGHPLADEIALQTEQQAARTKLALPLQAPIIGLLPGSRRQEVTHLTEVFLQTAAWCDARFTGIQFVVAAANERLAAIIQQQVKALVPNLNIRVIVGQSQQVMAAANALLLASGTATLEAMLVKRPMVVAYKLNRWTYALLRHLVRVKHIALPNLLADKRLVPEFIQQQATAENLGMALLNYLQHPTLVQQLTQQFTAIHQQLRCDASQQAARMVLALATN